MDHPVPVIHGDLFSREFKAFKKFVEERSPGTPLVSFEWNDYINSQEGYKKEIYEQGQKRLSFPKWKRSDIGSGKITEAVDSAIRLPGNKNNLIDWRIQGHWQSVPDIGDLERECYALYRTNNDRETFDRLVGLLGGRYELIAYLFFLKDRSRYLPIRPTRFDKVFKLLGIEFRTSKQCGWDNYATYIDLMHDLSELLSGRLGSEVTLLDAHSFSWILGSQMHENKEEVPVVPPGGDEDQEFTEARRMQHERMRFVRNRTLATAAKKRDDYKCVVCHFSPSLEYGQAHRTTALDCHHLKPLADRYDHTQSYSTLEDVATVCSNCHRLLHSDRKTLSLDEARNLLVVRESGEL